MNHFGQAITRRLRAIKLTIRIVAAAWPESGMAQFLLCQFAVKKSHKAGAHPHQLLNRERCAMPNAQYPASQICEEFEDVHSIVSWMQHITGPHRLVASGGRKIEFQHTASLLNAMGSTMGCVAFGTDVTAEIDEDAASRLSYSISLPLCGTQRLYRQGRLIESDVDHGMIVSPHAVQTLEINGNCRKLLVSITQPAMRRVLADLLQYDPRVPLIFEGRMDGALGDSASWWRMVKYMLGEFSSRHGMYLNPSFQKEMEISLIKGLILSQPSNYSDEINNRMKKHIPAYLLVARNFIEDHLTERLSLDDIEMAAGVHRSKLFDGFNEHFKSTPIAYAKRCRLERVRAEILQDLGRQNIAAIAMTWGFNHLGRFSSDYQVLFGEVPSVTVKRARERALRLF